MYRKESRKIIMAVKHLQIEYFEAQADQGTGIYHASWHVMSQACHMCQSTLFRRVRPSF